MTSAGPSLDYWQNRIEDSQMRMKFALSFIRQITIGLQQMHSFGFSHGDLKLKNICARPTHDGNFKFTLIDLGCSTKLPMIGEVTYHKKFRGNLLTASPDQIIYRRSSAIDDIYSLMCVAYHFVYKLLPWREFMHNQACEFSAQD